MHENRNYHLAKELAASAVFKATAVRGHCRAYKWAD